MARAALIQGRRRERRKKKKEEEKKRKGKKKRKKKKNSRKKNQLLTWTHPTWHGWANTGKTDSNMDKFFILKKCYEFFINILIFFIFFHSWWVRVVKALVMANDPRRWMCKVHEALAGNLKGIGQWWKKKRVNTTKNFKLVYLWQFY